MATETIAEKVPEALKEEDGVADTLKETGKKEAPVSDDKEEEKDEVKGQNMEEQGEVVDNGEGEEQKAAKEGKSPVTPVGERPTRIKKKVERYILPTPSRSSGSKPVSIEQGRGTQLKEIPNVAYKLSKRKPDDNLFLLHSILYGKKGKAQTLKRNIGQFSGYVWSEQEEEKQRARAKEKLEKCIKEKLIDFCDVLDIPINKSNVRKEELAVRVLEFLVHPKATRDILLADGEKETKSQKKSTPTNVTSGESSDVPAKRRRQTKKSGKKQDQPSETEEGNDEGNVGSEGTNEPRGEDDAAPEKENGKNKDIKTEDEKEKAEEDKSTDKKRSSKRTRKEKPAPEEEKSGGKSSKQVDKSTSSPSKKQKVDKDDSSKEKGKNQTSEPQAKESKDEGKASKESKREPTSNEIHVVVAKLLKEVDFNTVTLSAVLRMLGSHFGVDLMHRKIEVKDIITDAIREMNVDGERRESTEDEGEKNTEDEGEKMKVDEERKGCFSFSSHFPKSEMKIKREENAEKTV